MSNFEFNPRFINDKLISVDLCIAQSQIKTDKEKIEDVFNEVGIKFNQHDGFYCPNGIEIHESLTCSGYSGYMILKFDKDGKFEEVCSYE